MKMTLKEKVKETQLRSVGDIYVGGVRGCPANYSYLNKPELSSFTCNIENDCEDCWNQPFVEQDPTIKEKDTLNL